MLTSSALTVFARLTVDPFKRGVVQIQGSDALRDPARGGANIVIPPRVGSGVRYSNRSATAIALTGFRSGLAPRDLLAVPGYVFGGRTRWKVT